MPSSRVDNFVNSLRRREEDAAQQATASFPQAIEAPAPQAPTASRRSIFDPHVLSKLGCLELIAGRVVDGFLSGKHRSTHKGGCTDFAEFRPYMRGDDLRQLDWRHYAKCDRYYVKQFDDETNLQALLVVDASGSMQFGISTVSKWHYAQMAAACLGHLLLRQRDAVGLAVVGRQLHDFIRPLPRANHLARLINVLEQTEPQGQANVADVLLETAGRLRRRGLVMLLSDCFGSVSRLKHALGQFCARGHDVIVFQVLAPEELTFPFRREAFFQGLELPSRLQVNPNTVRKQYLAEFQKFLDELHDAIADLGGDLVTLTTDSDLGETLAHYLRRRSAMKKNQLARARA
ncbi:MAG: DUF58 domain-containing protein [Pirellulales bacterium]|nr:DUF58 domain-containing protein [Pirellulales bacterium]